MTFTTDTDMGEDAILREIEVMTNDPFVKAGLLAKSGAHKETEGLTVVDIGLKHEFGEGVPERSFIRKTYDEKNREWSEKMTTQARRIMEGKTTVIKSLGRLGLLMVKNIKGKIRQGDPSWEPLSAVTIARKKSTKPLIDTAQMINSIQHEVVTGKILQ